jgi:hypothetical protein
MKKREFMEIIRVAVRKELKEFLPTLVNECVNAISGEVSQPELDPVELTKQVLKTKSNKPKQQKSKVRYTQNEVLNNILNETSGGVPSGESRVAGGQIETPQVDFNGEEVQVEELPKDIATALTRDYSELMGAINKKKGVVS